MTIIDRILKNEYIIKAGISMPLRQALCLAQCHVETGGFKTFSENLNYSAEGLMKTWPKRFPADVAAKYARKPQAIANRAYANRMGNGDEASGDGWKFRGRGAKQVTGKDNYRACSLFLFGDERLLDDPDILLQEKYAIASAAWFWQTNRLNRFADKDDVVGLTKAINGGTNGLQQRIAMTKHYKLELGIDE